MSRRTRHVVWEILELAAKALWQTFCFLCALVYLLFVILGRIL